MGFLAFSSGWDCLLKESLGSLDSFPVLVQILPRFCFFFNFLPPCQECIKVNFQQRVCINKLSANLSENALTLPSCSNDSFVGYTKVDHIFPYNFKVLSHCLLAFTVVTVIQILVLLQVFIFFYLGAFRIFFSLSIVNFHAISKCKSIFKMYCTRHLVNHFNYNVTH